MQKVSLQRGLPTPAEATGRQHRLCKGSIEALAVPTEWASDLLDITHAMRHRVSIDTRHKILALAGLAEHMLGEDLNPNYSMTVEEAYDHLRSVVCF